ncbi:hypothetical protein GS530_05945 [Rhodococcus hoagii]|nr:hypothetical protein [Prescottella equi]
MAITRHRSKNGRLEGRLPGRFYSPVIDTADVFGSLNRYVSDLDDWVRHELVLPACRDVYHDRTYELLEEVAGGPLVPWVAEWIHVGMTG